jgi:tetratricopeptide (TPR) repeat protein
MQVDPISNVNLQNNSNSPSSDKAQDNNTPILGLIAVGIIAGIKHKAPTSFLRARYPLAKEGLKLFKWKALPRSLSVFGATAFVFKFDSTKYVASCAEKKPTTLDDVEARRIIASSTMPSELTEVAKIIGKATTLRRQSNYDAALQEVESLLNAYQSSEGMLAWIYMEKGHSLLAQGKFDLAYEAYNECLKRSEFDTFNQIYPSATYEQSKILSEKGNSELAIAKIQEAMKFIQENQKEKVEERLAQMQNRLGGFYLKQGNLELAKSTLEDTLAKQEKVYKTRQHCEIAITLQRLSQVSLALNDYQEAEKLAQESLQMNLNIIRKDNPEIGKGLFILGQIKEKENQLDQARDYYNQALKIYLQKRPDHPQVLEIKELLNRLSIQK